MAELKPIPITKVETGIQRNMRKPAFAVVVAIQVYLIILREKRRQPDSGLLFVEGPRTRSYKRELTGMH